MRKTNKHGKIIKLIITLFAQGLKITALIISRVLKALFKGFSKRLRFSITFKTASFYTVIFSTILFVFSIALISSFGFFLLNESRNSLANSAKVTLSFVSEGTGIPEVRIKKYADIEGINITLFNKQRGITYTTAVDKTKIKDIVLKDEAGGGVRTSITIGDIYLNMKAGLSDDVYYIQLFKPLARGIAYLSVLASAVTISFILAVLLTVMVGSRTLKRMLKPIGDMIKTTRSISAKDLQTRLNVVDSHDELKELAETFNDMLDRIQTSYEQQDRFVSDASHELRTPISVIQGYASLLQRWGKEDKEVLEESVSAIKNEADSMQNLVENLLFLARADKNTQKLEKSRFSVNELVDEVLKETKMIDTKHNITGEINNTITVDADRGLIKQALRVFVDNSIKYTPPGGAIKIDSWLKDNKAVITIEDTGIGISSEDLPFIFNRFYKCDKSRTREGGSSGLGLSIAKLIIEKHRGTITVESVLARGTKVIINLPS